MATIAFQAIGSTFGGPIGGMIGAVIGGVVDNALFGPGDQEGPRIDDLSVTTSTYGSGIPLIYGPSNRVAGNIIWSTDLVETKTSTGGGKGGGPETTEYSYRVSCAVALSRRQISHVKKIWANKKLIFDVTGGQALSPEYSPSASNGLITYERTSGSSSTLTMTNMSEIHVYQGTALQDADTIIEAQEGAGNVPAYRHTAYVVIKDLQLADFGNRIPSFEFEVVADSSITVGNASQDIIERAGVSNPSVFGLTDELTGYSIASQMPVYRAIAPLEVAYNFITTEQRGQIRCIKRAMGMKGTIPLNKMNARRPDNDRNKQPIEYKDSSEVNMPDRVTVTYKDIDSEYQRNSQSVSRRKGNALNKISQDLPLVLSTDQAKKIADRLLWGAWTNKISTSNTVSDQFSRLNPADVIGIPYNDRTLPMSIIRTTRGNDGVIEMESAWEDPEAFNSNATGQASSITAQELTVPGETVFVPLDAPLLRDENYDDGFYWAVSASSTKWRGASIKRSTDAGVTYETMSDVGIRTPIGTVSGTLGDGPTEVWDKTNTITVELTSSSSELESISELLVLNGGNAAWIGPSDGGVGEVVQFANATLVGTNTYELDTFLRGRRGTEHFTGSHTSGEKFVLLDKNTLGTNSFGTSDWDIQRYFKPVSILSDESATTAQTFTNTGVRAKPLSPVHVKGSRDGSNNLTITWIRRSRKEQPGLGKGTVPIGETSESYEIDIMNGATVLRTITASSETASYTAAQQTSDGLTPGDLISVNIYQISSTRGRGYAAEATI